MFSTGLKDYIGKRPNHSDNFGKINIKHGLIHNPNLINRSPREILIPSTYQDPLNLCQGELWDRLQNTKTFVHACQTKMAPGPSPLPCVKLDIMPLCPVQQGRGLGPGAIFVWQA